MMTEVETNPWALGLAGFLRENQEVEALHVNPDARTIEMATLGPVDMALLKARLAETVRRIEDEAGSLAGATRPVGVEVRE